jgi:Flp pilus assembly pilin Flp
MENIAKGSEVRGMLKQLAKRFATSVKRMRGDERGVTTVEYAIMLVLIALVVAASNPGIASAVKAVFSAMTANLALPA